MMNLGLLGSPDRMLLYFDVFDTSVDELRIETRLQADVPAEVWHCVVFGEIVASVTLRPNIHTSFRIRKPQGSTQFRLAMIPDGNLPSAADYWFDNSDRVILKWDPQKAHVFEVYYDQGLAGAVDTLLATIPGDRTKYLTDVLAAGTYVFNVIPVVAGRRSAPVDDASHEDITHTVNTQVLPPKNLQITSITESGGNYTIRITWDNSDTGSATYEYQSVVGASPEAINPNGTWAPCTSPLDVVVASAAGELFLCQVRSKVGANVGDGRTLHCDIPTGTGTLLIPDDTRIFPAYVRQDGTTIYCGLFAASTAALGTITVDLDYATVSGGPYTTISGWTTAAATQKGTLYFWQKEATVAGLSSGNTYYVRLRLRTSTKIGEWSNEAVFVYRAAPAAAAMFADPRGG